MEELPREGGVGAIDRLLLSGFYPRIHDVGIDPTPALGNYVDTYLGRDIRQLYAPTKTRGYLPRTCKGTRPGLAAL